MGERVTRKFVTCDPCGARYDRLNEAESYPHDLHEIYSAEPCELPTPVDGGDWCSRCLWAINWHDMTEADIKRMRKNFNDTFRRVCEEINAR